MQDDHSKQKSGTGNLRITFPPPPSFDLKAGQNIVFNGKHVTVRQTDDGELQIDDPEFIEQLLKMGFAPGPNNSPEQIERVLQHVPQEFRQDFLDGVMGKPRP